MLRAETGTILNANADIQFRQDIMVGANACVRAMATRNGVRNKREKPGRQWHDL